MLGVLLLNRMRNRSRNLRKQKLKSSNSPNLATVSEYCRTCMGHEDLMSIFYNRETAKRRTDDLKLVTGLEIKMNDGLSQKICTKCIESMNQALQFRLQSAKIDKQLRNLCNSEKNDETGNLNYLDDYGCTLKDNNKDTNDSDEDDKCYLTLSEDYMMDHDYLKLNDVPKKQCARRDSGDRPGKVYKCGECGREYHRRAAYRAHVNKHTNFRICEECGKKCLNNTMLIQHKRARHGLARVHLCSLCEYSSATKAGLITHTRRHTGERPYVCEHCGGAFHSRGGLVQHLPIHLAENNFECPICHKREKSKRLLQHHHYKVHKPKRQRYTTPEIQEPEAEESTVVEELQI